MDWLTILWLVIIVFFVALIIFVDRYFRKRRNRRRYGVPNDVSVGNYLDGFSSGKEQMAKFGGGSGGGAGATRNFVASTSQSASVRDGISENVLSSSDIAAIDTVENLLSVPIDIAGNAVEVAGDVVGSVAEAAGEIVVEIINNN